MTRRPFAFRTETFGLDTAEPWALSALRLLCNTPRAYEPLVQAWDERHPGTRKALARMVEMGYVAYQGPVLIDTRDPGALVERASRKVTRYRTTSRGHRFAMAVREDLRVFEDRYPRTNPHNVKAVARLLLAFDLEDTHAKYGLSALHAQALCDLPKSNVLWWVRRFLADGLLRALPGKLADVREVVPAHWRVTRPLCRQLLDVVDAFDTAPASLKVEFRLARSRFLDDIDPARVGISGATDYDHDVQSQRVLAALLRSPRAAADGIFVVEPRINLPITLTTKPWRFEADGQGVLFYQPDAELRERDESGTRLCVLEYERYQTRRDAWNHIERFLGWLHTMTLPFESAVLRFVVDSDQRVASYTDLIAAFADHALDHPELIPANPVQLAVASTPRLLSAPDPLDPRAWWRIPLPAGDCADTERRPVLHAPEDSPYDEYFARA